jgi:predicted XRE-type DNA-binding protein
MKVKKVVPNNRKKAFEVFSGKRAFEYPYSRLELKPTEADPIESVFPDPEIGLDGFTYRLVSGKEDTILLDQVLEYEKDPDYLRKMLIFKLTMEAKRRLDRLGISKREVIRRMGVAPTQFYRLMDSNNEQKTIDQMVRLLAALDCTVDIVFKEAA